VAVGPGPIEPGPVDPPVPAIPSGPISSGPATAQPGLLDAVLSAAVSQVSAMVKPDAVAAVAKTFTFPLALMLLVLLYLVVQHRMDRLDPKLRTAPQSASQTVVAFQEEEQL
jgi:hypothetical protein